MRLWYLALFTVGMYLYYLVMLSYLAYFPPGRSSGICLSSSDEITCGERCPQDWSAVWVPSLSVFSCGLRKDLTWVFLYSAWLWPMERCWVGKEWSAAGWPLTVVPVGFPPRPGTALISGQPFKLDLLLIWQPKTPVAQIEGLALYLPLLYGP